MGSITIYGASDDLIEIEASDFSAEEFNVYADDDNARHVFLAVSDGTVLRVRYDEDGIWRFTPTVVGSASYENVQGLDDCRHTDRVTLTGENLRWVVLGFEIAK